MINYLTRSRVYIILLGTLVHFFSDRTRIPSGMKEADNDNLLISNKIIECIWKSSQ